MVEIIKDAGDLLGLNTLPVVGDWFKEKAKNPINNLVNKVFSLKGLVIVGGSIYLATKLGLVKQK